MKHKSFYIKAEAVKDDGFFVGYGSVFNVRDSYGDIVRPGAFAASLADWAEKGKAPKLLWQHDPSQPIGVWEKLEEDDHGLRMEGRLLIEDVPKAREAYALLKAGAIDGLSIGYSVKRAKWNDDEDALDLFALNLWETSIVTFPANEAATVSEVKNALQRGELPTLKEFEKFLRDAGFSNSQATAIAGHGLRKLLPLGEPDNDIEKALSILKS